MRFFRERFSFVLVLMVVMFSLSCSPALAAPFGGGFDLVINPPDTYSVYYSEGVTLNSGKAQDGLVKGHYGPFATLRYGDSKLMNFLYIESAFARPFEDGMTNASTVAVHAGITIMSLFNNMVFTSYDCDLNNTAPPGEKQQRSCLVGISVNLAPIISGGIGVVAPVSAVHQ